MKNPIDLSEKTVANLVALLSGVADRVVGNEVANLRAESGQLENLIVAKVQAKYAHLLTKA